MSEIDPKESILCVLSSQLVPSQCRHYLALIRTRIYKVYPNNSTSFNSRFKPYFTSKNSNNSISSNSQNTPPSSLSQVNQNLISPYQITPTPNNSTSSNSQIEPLQFSLNNYLNSPSEFIANAVNVLLDPSDKVKKRGIYFIYLLYLIILSEKSNPDLSKEEKIKKSKEIIDNSKDEKSNKEPVEHLTDTAKNSDKRRQKLIEKIKKCGENFVGKNLLIIFNY